ncbi:MAG TPA: type VI secretion system accessory protein TagJ [Bryobacteraceae bacterium]|nr:type VI secretion system accessory protein TagJ [Bryobacteraceae bacterium]
MTAKQLFQAGKLTEAVRALSAEVRDNPTDAQRRTFLFELLCFAGEYDRAEKQLNVLASGNSETQLGAVLYHSALHAEKTRQEMFARQDLPLQAQLPQLGGTLNGAAFESIEDADPRIGPRLEVFAAGAYLWIPFEHITSVETQPPKKLRDMLWLPALVRTGPAFQDKELGEVLIPVIYPHSGNHADENIRLGRSTVWDENGIPGGQKMLLLDGEEFPILEVRNLEFTLKESA